MEIITYVIQGALEHKDSLGTGSVIRPGEIQRMSAGQGIHHSEYNHSPIEPLHLLQIWIHPEKENLTPSYEQKPIKKINNQLILIGSRHGDEHSVTIHQDVQLFLSYLNKDHSIAYDFKQKRQGWIQLIRGEIVVNGIRLIEGDGASLVQEKQVTIESVADAEFLFFDLNA
jgi:redox-sensitive bicupin YhaK (pirin superfamily)